MIIEDKITEWIDKRKKINDNIIYLVDYEIHISRIKVLKTKKVRTERKKILIDMLYQKNPGEINEAHLYKNLRNICEAKDDETLEITKIILKKEISCSFYKR